MTKYSWENMRDEIQDYIRQCLPCQLKKLVRRKVKNEMQITDTPSQAGQKLSIYIVGPLTTTKKIK